jgi:hypothetical protein
MSAERLANLGDHRLAVASTAVVRLAAAAGLALLAAAASIIVMRRLAGALTQALPPTAILVGGLLLAAAAVAIRLAWFLPTIARPSPRQDRGLMLTTSLVVAGLGLGLCVPDTPFPSKLALGVPLAAEEGCLWTWFLIRKRRHFAAQASLGASPRPSRGKVSNDITQQLTRSRAADGVETLTGWLRTPLAAGQRNANIHLAFCPPFAATPLLEVEQIDGPPARIKMAQVLPYGVRFDLKLAAAAEESSSVLLQFVATSDA